MNMHTTRIAPQVTAYTQHMINRDVWAAQAKACRNRRDMQAEAVALDRVKAATNAMLVCENTTLTKLNAVKSETPNA